MPDTTNFMLCILKIFVSSEDFELYLLIYLEKISLFWSCLWVFLVRSKQYLMFSPLLNQDLLSTVFSDPLIWGFALWLVGKVTHSSFIWASGSIPPHLLLWFTCQPLLVSSSIFANQYMILYLTWTLCRFLEFFAHLSSSGAWACTVLIPWPAHPLTAISPCPQVYPMTLVSPARDLSSTMNHLIW